MQRSKDNASDDADDTENSQTDEDPLEAGRYSDTRSAGLLGTACLDIPIKLSEMRLRAVPSGRSRLLRLLVVSRVESPVVWSRPRVRW